MTIRPTSKLINLAAACCLLLSQVAHAGSSQSNNNALLSDRILDDGIYLNFKAGVSQFESPDQNLLYATDASHRLYGPTAGADIGYLYFTTDHLFTDVQLGANYLGNMVYKGSFSDGSSTRSSIEQYEFNMLFGLGAASNTGFNIGGKFGVARVTQLFKDLSGQAGDSLTGRSDLTRYRPKAEVDLGFVLNSSTNLTLSYAHIFGRSETNFPVNNDRIFTSNTLMLGVTYVLPD